jgi:amidase
MESAVQCYQTVDQMVEPTPPVNYPRTKGFMPHPQENPYNAW